MTLQGSGTIRFSEISNEFGLPPGKNIGAYRVSESFSGLVNMPLDTGIPQSGRINFSDFYNKKLNMVVDCYSQSGAIQQAFHFDTYQALNTGLRDCWFRVDNPSQNGSDVYLTSFGSGVALVPIRIRVLWESPVGRSFSRITIQQGAAAGVPSVSDIVIDFTTSIDITVNAYISSTPLRVTFTGLERDIRYLDMGNESTSLEVSRAFGSVSGIPSLAKGLALRDSNGDDSNTRITIGTATPVSGNNTRVSNAPLYPFKANPLSFSGDFATAGWIARYAVTPINVWDTSNDYSVISVNNGSGGVYIWVYTISIPGDGNYRIRAVADDGATIQFLPSSLQFTAGFAGSEYDQTVFLRGGTYQIRVTYDQCTTCGPIKTTDPIGNPTYFAMTIDASTAAPVDISSAINKCGLKSRYNNLPNSTRVIGGFRGKPSSTSGTKVWADANNTIYNGSQRNGTNTAAFRTGIWDPGTELIVNVGPSGKIYGYGGRGGDGGGATAGSTAGERAGAAFSAQTSCVLRNYGLIYQGYGGGGGGNGASFTTQICTSRVVGSGRNRRTVTTCVNYANFSGGGGGGGGTGLPFGQGGDAGRGGYGPEGRDGSSGSPGSNLSSGGAGGAGGSRAGSGGKGGILNKSSGNPGQPSGENGAAITSAPGVTVTVQNFGTITGRTLTNINTDLFD